LYPEIMAASHQSRRQQPIRHADLPSSR
jgi:hypothetical protein